MSDLPVRQEQWAERQAMRLGLTRDAPQWANAIDLARQGCLAHEIAAIFAMSDDTVERLRRG